MFAEAATFASEVLLGCGFAGLVCAAQKLAISKVLEIKNANLSPRFGDFIKLSILIS